MASSEKDPIQECVQEFRKGLQSAVPLRHFSDHQDEAKIRNAAQLESDKVLDRFVRKIKKVSLNRRSELFSQLFSELEKTTEEYVKKNQDYKGESKSVFLKRINLFCKDFRTSMNAKLLKKPDMDLKSMEEFFENGALKAMDYFEYIWMDENVEGFEEQKTKLKQKLDGLKKKTLGKQSRHLKSKADEEARNSLTEIQKILLAMCGQIKSDIDDRSEDTNINRILRENVRSIINYLISKGKVLQQKFGKLYTELLGLMENSTKFLGGVLEDMSKADAVEWTEKIITQLKVSFECGNEVLKRGNGSEMTINVSVPALIHQDETSNGDVVTVTETLVPPETQLSNDRDAISATTSKIRRNVPARRSNAENDVNLKRGVKRAHQGDLEASSPIVTTPVPKRFKQSTQPKLRKDKGLSSTDDNNPLNVKGKFPLLLAISKGRSLKHIEKMLDDGANVNILTKHQENAAHKVIQSLKNKSMNTKQALAVLNLLIARGFSLINKNDKKGLAPIQYAMKIEGLDEELLSWFLWNGGNVNDILDKNGSSVLLQAIKFRQDVGIIRKILDFGGDPEHANKFKNNALHMSAFYAHESAMEIFIKTLNVNACNKYKRTPLHCLFTHDGLDYQKCFELLLGNGADFCAKSNQGYVPLVHWMKNGKGHPFPVLMKTKHLLPITQEIASDTITAIVEEMGRFQKFLPSSSRGPHNEFPQFITFLLEEKKAKLRFRLNDESEIKWKLAEWGKLNQLILTPNFCKELDTHMSDREKWKGELTRIEGTTLGILDFHLRLRSAAGISVSVETVLLCLLATKKYKSLQVLCKLLSEFCSLV